MGYRSDVMFKVGKNSRYALAMFAVQYPKSWHEIIRFKEELEIVPENSKYEEPYCFRLYTQGTKWYSHFDEVKAVENFWQFLQQIDEDYTKNGKKYPGPIDAVYIRLGEEADDVEENSLGNGCELAYITRDIAEDW